MVSSAIYHWLYVAAFTVLLVPGFMKCLPCEMRRVVNGEKRPMDVCALVYCHTGDFQLYYYFIKYLKRMVV